MMWVFRIFWTMVTLRSLVRALSDLGLAALCLAAWINPLSMAGFLAVVERLFLGEFVLLFVFIVLTAVGAEERRVPQNHVPGAVLALALVTLMIVLLSRVEGSLWLVAALLLLVGDKLQYYFLPDAHRRQIAFQRMLALFGRCILLIIAMLLPMLMPLPTLGMSAEVFAMLDEDPALTFTTLHFLVTGVIYFGVIGVLQTLDFGVADRLQQAKAAKRQRVGVTSSE